MKYIDKIKTASLKKDAIILAIESSCDETACAVIKGGREILSSEIMSSMTEHIPFGGVVPEIASRMHTTAISLTVKNAVEKAKIPTLLCEHIVDICERGLVDNVDK